MTGCAMKYLKTVVTFILILSFTFCPSAFAAEDSQLDDSITNVLITLSLNNLETVPTKDFRGLWVSTVVNIDYPVKPTTDSEVLKSETVKILDYAKNTGFNAVFLQVRPTTDAYYDSEIFPWSKYLTGKQGVAPTNQFDPLEFWVSEAHKRGIELHAWINPYRVTKKTAKEPAHDFASLHPSNPARKNPGWVVKHSDGNLYFNPGIPEVRRLIVDGVIEIVENYDVDGIHFDDYFYPDSNFNDADTYKKYNTLNRNLGDWRRDNVNSLVKEVSDAIKATGRTNVRFGISPFGIWANKASNPAGSDTKGLQSYYSHYADSLYWINNNLIDYILPQLYWNIGYSIADYEKLAIWWENAVKNSSVDLYIGHAAYKSNDSDSSSPWYGTSEIERQLRMNEASSIIKGSVLFTYNEMAKRPDLTYSVKSIFDARDGKLPLRKLKITRPSSNITTSLKSFYLNGSSDASLPLYLNGKLVENRSPQGYFGILVSLSEGVNTFTFTQDGEKQTCTITRKASSSGAQKMNSVEIPVSSTFPQAQEYWMPGEEITLSCQAPAGANVSVKLNGTSYNMKQTSGPSNPSGLYKATYSLEYTIPTFTGAPRNVDLGAPVYTVNYKGTVKTQKAPANIGVILEGSRFLAKVPYDVVDTYNAPVSGNGAAYELYKGMVDYVTGMTGSYARLSSGQWVFKNKVEIYYDSSYKRPVVRSAKYNIGETCDVFELTFTSPAAAIVSYDGEDVVLTVSAPSSAALPFLPADSLISQIDSSTTLFKSEYVLAKKEDKTIEGYYIEKTDTGIRLVLKHKPEITDKSSPLTGITIMLDPGHGGSEPGAIGPLGYLYAEKDLNLDFSFKLKEELEELGADVLMTRTDDSTLSLQDRLSMSRKARPDMFISLHSNSMADNVDISKVYGFSVFYREPLAKESAQLVYDYVIDEHGRKKLGVNKKNFYVTRNTWAPSFLLENGFVPNPFEFEWLTDETEQQKLANTVAEAIVEYYKH